MHGSSLCRMRWFVENFLADARGRRVLDIGSCDVAGGTYKQFFPADRFFYQGLDLVPGPNVDIVPKLPYWWPELPDNSFDVVISGQAFEHMEFFWLAAAEMARILKNEGLMCVVAPRGFARHRYPVDCYRFDADGMIAIARFCGLVPLHASMDMAPEPSCAGWHLEEQEDAFLIAQKPLPWPGIARAATYTFAQPDAEKLCGDFVPCEKPLPPPMVPLPEHTAILQELHRQLEQKEAILSLLGEELAQLRRLVAGYEQSNSWRLTKPLRALRALWRKARTKIRSGTAAED